MQMCVAVREIYFLNFCVWTERKETGRQSGTEFEKEKGGVGGELREGGFRTKELRVRVCVYIYIYVRVSICTCVCVYGWKDFRMDVIYRWEHFVTERFRGSHSHYLVSSVSPSAESRVAIIVRV